MRQLSEILASFICIPPFFGKSFLAHLNTSHLVAIWRWKDEAPHRCLRPTICGCLRFRLWYVRRTEEHDRLSARLSPSLHTPSLLPDALRHHTGARHDYALLARDSTDHRLSVSHAARVSECARFTHSAERALWQAAAVSLRTALPRDESEGDTFPRVT